MLALHSSRVIRFAREKESVSRTKIADLPILWNPFCRRPGLIRFTDYMGWRLAGPLECEAQAELLPCAKTHTFASIRCANLC